jgi:hypothetical protein
MRNIYSKQEDLEQWHVKQAIKNAVERSKRREETKRLITWCVAILAVLLVYSDLLSYEWAVGGLSVNIIYLLIRKLFQNVIEDEV